MLICAVSERGGGCNGDDGVRRERRSWRADAYTYPRQVGYAGYQNGKWQKETK